MALYLDVKIIAPGQPNQKQRPRLGWTHFDPISGLSLPFFGGSGIGQGGGHRPLSGQPHAWHGWPGTQLEKKRFT